jgi:hypothetical protein
MVKFVLHASSIGAILGCVDGLKLAKNVSPPLAWSPLTGVVSWLYRIPRRGSLERAKLASGKQTTCVLWFFR